MSKDRLVNVFVCFIIPAFILSYARISIFTSNQIVYLLYFLIAFSGINLYSMKFYYLTEFRGFLRGILVSVLFIPIFAFSIKSISGILYIVLLIVFAMTLTQVASYLSNDLLYLRTIKFWWISSQVLLTYLVIINIGEVNINTITAIFFNINSNKYRYRAAFGLGHPNSAALVILSTIFINYIVYKEEKNRKLKMLTVTLILIDIIPFICTGSRTAVIGFVIFILLEISFWILKYSKKYRNLVLAFAVIGAGIIISNLNFTEILKNSSGRDVIIENSLNKLGIGFRMLVGYEVSNISNTGSELKSNDISGTDNWYYMWMLRFGIIGICIICMIIIHICINLYKRYFLNIISNSYCISAMIVLLIYGFTENVVYNQGVILTFVILTVAFSNLIRYKQCSTKIRKQEYS